MSFMIVTLVCLTTSGPEAPEFGSLKGPVYDRFLQSLVVRLDHQFGSHFALAASISNLLPQRVPSVSFNDIEHIADFYAESKAITQNKDYIKSQFEHWKAKCSRMPATLCGVREAIRRCRAESTPDIHKLLLIYATIPVSSAASERSFSDMKRLKSYLRSTITEQRLTGLALAHSHKDVPISTERMLLLPAQVVTFLVVMLLTMLSTTNAATFFYGANLVKRDMDDLSLDKLGALRLNLEELRIAYDYCSALPQLLRMRLVQGNEQTAGQLELVCGKASKAALPKERTGGSRTLYVL
ncbi:repressor of the inhibitor of the kinase-like protein [Aphelenchoides avenae]|nr:repressor of the inhibitor of the kinase-like protein [Aphelenchus avenae]